MAVQTAIAKPLTPAGVTRALRALWPAPIHLTSSVLPDGRVQVQAPKYSLTEAAGAEAARILGEITGRPWTCAGASDLCRSKRIRLTFVVADSGTQPALPGTVPLEQLADSPYADTPEAFELNDGMGTWRPLESVGEYDPATGTYLVGVRGRPPARLAATLPVEVRPRILHEGLARNEQHVPLRSLNGTLFFEPADVDTCTTVAAGRWRLATLGHVDLDEDDVAGAQRWAAEQLGDVLDWRAHEDAAGEFWTAVRGVAVQYLIETELTAGVWTTAAQGVTDQLYVKRQSVLDSVADTVLSNAAQVLGLNVEADLPYAIRVHTWVDGASIVGHATRSPVRRVEVEPSLEAVTVG